MKRILFSTVLLCGLSALPVQARYLVGETYSVCRNDIFIDYDNFGVKRIVIEKKDNGDFIAEDLSTWCKTHEIYNVTLAHEAEFSQLMFYEVDMENLDDEFSDSEGVAYIDFEHIVSEGDIIGFTEDSMERVVYVFNDGSFYSVIEPSPFAGEEAD